MADERYRKRIRKEVTCSVCLEYFTRPVELGCRHNFCERCILRCWEESGEETRCPECRKSVEKDFKRNRLLTNMVGIMSEWDHSEEREAQRRRSECQRHQKTLDLYCRDDEVLFCRECDASQGHSGHRVIPVAEAVQDYKDQLFKCLETLNEEKAKIEANKARTSSESDFLVKKVMYDRRKMKGELKQLRSFLGKWENQQLKEMEEVETQIVTKTHDQLAKLSRELCSLQSVIQELEEKLQQPPSELLQDIRTTLHRHEGRQTFEAPNIFPPELLWKVWDFRDINSFLEAVVEQFKASVTLDPATAHPHLTLTEDRQSARWGEAHQELPDNPERFSGHTLVLGCEEFTAGRHCWEVTVGTDNIWAVGVARKTVKRKGLDCFSPEAGIWGLGQLDSKPRSARCSLPLPGPKLKRFRVTVNYAGRRILFFDCDTGDLVKSFTKAEFSGDPLLPIFCVGPETYLELHPVTH
ncbi:E3 ubiquitin-protein ligase TRIM11-like [Lacerta agilis]|uniref:E3 ubiquitin-protein ligase TRIM11-like n=1 Tax=Lacerta agilis TaxID=80427 RepID=UPI00141A01F6|nr:E3 ubiquitin-protein ligase TRIM11-like [Lacerta agilis]